MAVKPLACGRMFVTAAPTDDHVRELVLDALNDPKVAARFRQRDTTPDDLHARIRADEDELEALAADHGTGKISRAEWKAARAPIVARIEAARTRLERSSLTRTRHSWQRGRGRCAEGRYRVCRRRRTQ